MFLNSIFDTESKYVYYRGSNKYIIAKTKCWPVFKQDPYPSLINFSNPLTELGSVVQKAVEVAVVEGLGPEGEEEGVLHPGLPHVVGQGGEGGGPDLVQARYVGVGAVVAVGVRSLNHRKNNHNF